MKDYLINTLREIDYIVENYEDAYLLLAPHHILDLRRCVEGRINILTQAVKYLINSINDIQYIVWGSDTAKNLDMVFEEYGIQMNVQFVYQNDQSNQIVRRQKLTGLIEHVPPAVSVTKRRVRLKDGSLKIERPPFASKEEIRETLSHVTIDIEKLLKARNCIHRNLDWYMDGHSSIEKSGVIYAKKKLFHELVNIKDIGKCILRNANRSEMDKYLKHERGKKCGVNITSRDECNTTNNIYCDEVVFYPQKTVEEVIKIIDKICACHGPDMWDDERKWLSHCACSEILTQRRGEVIKALDLARINRH